MSQYAIRLGFWSATLCAATFIVFTGCFVAILSINPLFIWTTFEDWVAYNRQNSQFFKYTAQLMMLLFGPLFVVLVSSIYDYAREDKGIFARIALGFAIIFATLTGMHYFLQISVVRLNMGTGQLQGLEQFIQGNPTSALSGINMLGWTLFFGLASIFLAPIFTDGRLENVIRFALLANGIFVLLGMVGFIFQITIIVFVLMNLGMGAAVLSFTTALALLFHRLGNNNQLSASAAAAADSG